MSDMSEMRGGSLREEAAVWVWGRRKLEKWGKNEV